MLKQIFQKKRFRICLKEDEMAELLHDSTQSFKCNMLDRYLDCPLLPFAVKSVQFSISFAMQNF